jgi:hypothetical protein
MKTAEMQFFEMAAPVPRKALKQDIVRAKFERPN